MTSKIVREIIDKHLDPEREFIYGFADLTCVIDSQFGDFRYGISIGKRLDNRIVDKIRNGPTLEYYTHYTKINEELTSLAEKISKALQAISGRLWDITVCRDEFFDPFKCRQKCKEFGEKYLKMDVRVCGICVSVCPVGS